MGGLYVKTYTKPLIPTPTPVTWGTEHEPVAIKKYISYQNFTISVKKCGFIIHPEKGWLGASTCKGISGIPTL